METLSELLAICEGNPPVTGSLWDSPHKGPLMQGFNVFFVASLKNIEQTLMLRNIWDAMTLMLRL